MALRHLACASVGFLFLVATGATDRALAQNWDGTGQLRVGAFIQGSQVDYDALQQPGTAAPFRQTASPDGFGGGVTAGYDLRLGRFVIGGEADVAFMSGGVKGSGSAIDHYGVDYISTVRGRLGYLVHPEFMIYGTAGLGMLGAEYKYTGPGVIATQTGIIDKKNANMAGYTVGGGLEYDRGWGILFAEYLYSDYGSWSFQNFNGNRISVDATSNVIRAGVKFKVGHDYEATDDWRRPERSDRLK